ncbi:unnamed protein product [Allacma fusca]|uniref:Uncharacterized protein n=1 Tax=Allacma fusca TaxID=39272 RepID=A0A8J2Q3N5_9HEXA|nr:unnamed protein product [Allacma fusca]
MGVLRAVNSDKNVYSITPTLDGLVSVPHKANAWSIFYDSFLFLDGTNEDGSKIAILMVDVHAVRSKKYCRIVNLSINRPSPR